jgi:transposase
MPRTRPPYPPEFKVEAVKLARSSQKPLSELARDLGVSAETLRNWTKQQQIDAGQRDGITTDEREELRRLRRENKILKEEREVLRKATAFFAREENDTRRRR